MADRTPIRLERSEAYLLFFLMGIYFVSLQLRLHQIGPELFRNHLSNMIFIPLLLLSVRVVQELIGLGFRIGTKAVLIAVLYSVIVFEINSNDRGTGFDIDHIDIICYTAGGLVYLVVKNVFVSKNN